MERLYRPERLDVDPSSPAASKQWLHWLRTFENFVSSFPTDQQPNKLNLLINHVSPSVFEYVSECESYDSAINILKELYNKPKNVIFARHLLATCKQESGQTLDQYLQKLKSLARDCNFKDVTASQNRDDAIRDAFITGIQDSSVRQRLLEHESLNLQKAYDTARSLELAQKQSQTYTLQTPSLPCGAAAPQDTEISDSHPTDNNTNAHSSLNAASSKCFFCGFGRHHRSKCPARDAICRNCDKKGHFSKVCQSPKNKAAALHVPVFVLAGTASDSLKKSTIKVQLNGETVNALIDTGSSESFICEDLVKSKNLHRFPSKTKIGMASSNFTSTTSGHVQVKINYGDNCYDSVKLSILPKLCSDVILGHDFLSVHEKLEIKFNGHKGPLSICGVAAANVEEQSLFSNLKEDCRPIAAKSRRFNHLDKQFIESQITSLLQDNIIEPSNSPWRAQVLVTTNERHKKRMVVDYSQTINRFTLLDAYPQKNISEMVEQISQYKIFSTLDLRSAYHQIPIKKEERHFTAFEAGGMLYQFTRIPFGVTNGVAAFQRVMDEIIQKEGVKDTFSYVDNITVCGNDQEHHDKNLKELLTAAKKHGISFNEKGIISSPVIRVIGYEVKQGEIRPDPERLQALKDLEPPSNSKSQQRAMGLFAYYSQWIHKFSEKSYPLSHNNTFPLPNKAMDSFLLLKKELEDAVLTTYDPNEQLTVETDASEFAIAATLNQKGRPIAFFSRTLNQSERNHSSVEKEAQAIVEALQKWKHYLLGHHFKLVTDQRSVSFMFSPNKGKVKNEKIQRWRLELSLFNYDIVYRPGKENVGADAFSRCAAISNHVDLMQLHKDLCHPGIIRMLHFVKSRNLPFSTDDVKRTISTCQACAQIKPQFYTNQQNTLIKATQPFERLSMDFKGPIPSVTVNKYILTVIDEFSRFPFAFACPDTSTKTVINCLTQLFCIFGMPAFVHSDRGASFMSEELKNFLHQKGVATSRSTPYNPRGNGQVERLNDTLWKTISLALKSNSLNINHWEHMLPQALHSVRSLLCTATNTTPHERMFSFNRRSSSGTTLPAWLSVPGTVLMRNYVRQSKYDPLVEEVELLECNPQYAHVRYSNGRESTVATRHLAPAGTSEPRQNRNGPEINEPPLSTSPPDCPTETANQDPTSENLPDVSCPQSSETTTPETPTDTGGADPVRVHDIAVKQQRLHPYNLRNRVASLQTEQPICDNVCLPCIFTK